MKGGECTPVRRLVDGGTPPLVCTAGQGCDTRSLCKLQPSLPCHSCVRQRGVSGSPPLASAPEKKKRPRAESTGALFFREYRRQYTYEHNQNLIDNRVSLAAYDTRVGSDTRVVLMEIHDVFKVCFSHYFESHTAKEVDRGDASCTNRLPLAMRSFECHFGTVAYPGRWWELRKSAFYQSNVGSSAPLQREYLHQYSHHNTPQHMYIRTLLSTLHL